LLKNVHLAPQWLTELEKKIYNMQLDQNFRLFLTMENNPKVPATLIRASHVMIFEPPSGIKAALLRSYNNTITPQRTDKEPVERKRLHFIVSWFNAVVQERLRYTPIGWSKVYEFNESDQRCTLDCIDEWIDSLGTNRSNIDPEKIPWDAIKTLISQSVFGGKIDNEFDQKILLSLVDKFFNARVYEEGFKLFDPPVGTDEESLVVPDNAKSHKDYLSFIMNDIKLTETPAWSGLPNNVEKIVRERAANSLIANIKLI
jgi:dynein heavy chain 1, cytosolic